ncbi:MAG: tyrosine-type recombinase/integrase [Coriobacteriales bacterium]
MRASKEAATMSRHIAGFLGSYAPSQLTSSGNTLKSYRTAISLYIEFLEGEKGVTDATFGRKCFERPVIEEWVQWLRRERGSSASTCNNRLGSLRAFLKYLAGRGPEYAYLQQEASQIPRMKEQKKKVEGMSKEAVKALMECPDASTRTGKRDLVLMVVLYATAARIDEVLSLKVGQLHLDCARPYANIIGKGDKVRTLNLLPKAVAHIKAYLQEFHGSGPDPDAYLFYSRNAGPSGKMTQPAVDKMLKKHAKKAAEQCKDVPVGLHAHQFRHAKASHWLEDGMNIVQISLLLGHESLETTMRYLDVTLDDERAALATLEDENEKKVAPKWKNGDGSLKALCGLG